MTSSPARTDPPRLVTSHPRAIGLAIPDGSFRLAPVPGHPEPDTGELVYDGPNVMLGYAETAADLSLGRTTTELHTGDLARRTAAGLYEIVGRRSGFVKVFGLRIDLQQVETALERRGLVAACAGEDGELVVVLEAGGHGTGGHGTGEVDRARRAAAERRRPAGAGRTGGNGADAATAAER